MNLFHNGYRCTEEEFDSMNLGRVEAALNEVFIETEEATEAIGKVDVEHLVMSIVPENGFLRCVSQLEALSTVDKHHFKPQSWNRDYVYKASIAFTSSRLETWQVIAAQVLLDTQHRLDGCLSLGYQILRRTCEHLRRSYRDFLDTQSVERTGAEQITTKKKFEAQVKRIEDIANGSGLQSYIKRQERKKKWHHLSVENRRVIWRMVYSPNFILLENRPALCSIILSDLRDASCQISLDIADDAGHILIVAHLNNSARQTDELNEHARWDDMNDIVDCVYRVLGLDSANAKFKSASKSEKKSKSKNKNTHKQHAAIGSPRPFQYMARYSRISADREKKARGANTADCDALAIAQAMTDIRTEGNDSKVDLNTLAEYKLPFENDELASNFNVLGLHLTCLELLGEIQSYCLTNPPGDYPKNVYGKRASVNVLVADLLRELTGHERQHEGVLPKVFAMMRSVMEAKGGDGLAEARMLTQEMRIAQNVFHNDNEEEAETAEGSAESPSLTQLGSTDLATGEVWDLEDREEVTAALKKESDAEDEVEEEMEKDADKDEIQKEIEEDEQGDDERR
ncbi:hypothetical protein EK21DRAFT_116296 [Setomelanomma holmii]|uniref:Uncharacterized protein n=1 Tax=Setomelanomma holmii TaxID=210430 RepID=A0A9P4H1M4_9PLEO|nr:hypothetical protein EK21DRAFT_116296 [Setomelanomma holmii]